jgi:hypothetical protein
MRHTITPSIVNTATGTPGSFDGVMMMVLQVPSTLITPLIQDTAYLGSKLADFTALGVTSDYDYVNGISVFQQVNEFYDGGNNDGAYLWLVVTSSAVTMDAYVITTTFKNLIRGTVQTDPNMKVKMLGIGTKPPAIIQSASDFPSTTIAAITALQATQAALFLEGFQFSCLIAGDAQSSTATSTSIQSMATKLAPSVSLVNVGGQPNGVASIGAALGRFSRISVGHGFGAVEDGPIALQSAFLTNGAYTPILGTTITQGTNLTATHSYMVVNGPVTYNGNVYSVGQTFTVIAGTLTFAGASTTVVDLTTTGAVTTGLTYYVQYGPVTYNTVIYSTGQSFTAVAAAATFTGGIIYDNLATSVTKLYNSDINSYGDKQYMFIRKWFSAPGLYWNDGATCDLATKPLSTQEFNRVGNKLSSNANDFLTLLMGKAIPLDVKTNAPALTFTSAKSADFETTYIDPLIASGDISGGSMTLTGVRNGQSTVNWTYVLNINGNPITGSVTGTVQFV